MAALTTAYKAVTALGYTHQQLVSEHIGVNFNTLRRIRKGRQGKESTDMFYLSLFVTILEENYQKRICNGGDGSREILLSMKSILFAALELPQK